jgi:hypothetical protein
MLQMLAWGYLSENKVEIEVGVLINIEGVVK